MPRCREYQFVFKFLCVLEKMNHVRLGELLNNEEDYFDATSSADITTLSTSTTPVNSHNNCQSPALSECNDQAIGFTNCLAEEVVHSSTVAAAAIAFSDSEGEVCEDDFVYYDSGSSCDESKFHSSASTTEFQGNSVKHLLLSASANNGHKSASDLPTADAQKKSPRRKRHMFNLHAPHFRSSNKHQASSNSNTNHNDNEDTASTSTCSSSLSSHQRHGGGIDSFSKAINAGANFIRKRHSSKRKDKDSGSGKEKASPKVRKQSSKILDAEETADSKSCASTVEEAEEALPAVPVSASLSHFQHKLGVIQKRLLKPSTSNDSKVRFNNKGKGQIKIFSHKQQQGNESGVESDASHSPQPPVVTEVMAATDFTEVLREAIIVNSTYNHKGQVNISQTETGFSLLGNGSLSAVLISHYKLVVVVVLCLLTLCPGFPSFLSGLLWGFYISFLIGVLVFWLLSPRALEENDSIDELGGCHDQLFAGLQSQDSVTEDTQKALDTSFDTVTYKGWMNELPSHYVAAKYHINGTRSVLVRLNNSVLRLSLPKQNVLRHAFWAESRYEQTSFISQRMLDMSGSTVVLRPKNLARRRWWSRKYPICIIFRAGSEISVKEEHIDSVAENKSKAKQNVVDSGDFQNSDESHIDDTDNEEPSLSVTRSASIGHIPSKHFPRPGAESKRKVLYLFARSGREKEHWFHRLRRAACHYEYRSSRGLLSAQNLFLDVALSASETPQKRSRSTSCNVKDGCGSLKSSCPKIRCELFVCKTDPQQGSPLRRSQSENDMAVSESALVEDTSQETDINNGSDLDPLATEWIMFAGLHQQFSNYMSKFIDGSINKDLLGGSTDGNEVSCDLFTMNFKTDDLPVNNQLGQTNIAWANSLTARIFWDFMRDPLWLGKVRDRIQRKLATVRLPYFIETLTLTKLEPNLAMPKITSVSEPKFNEWGLWINQHLIYSGGLCLVLETKVNLMKLKDEAGGTSSRNITKSSRYSDSEIPESPESSADDEPMVPLSIKKDKDENGSPKQSTGKKILQIVDKVAQSKYFQEVAENKYVKKVLQGISDTPLVLTVEVKYVEGIMCLNVPPPPTDRIWYGFKASPKLLLRAHPKVGDRSLNVSHITDWIEAKLQSLFEKNLVIPNMDDLVIPVMRGAPMLKKFNV